MKIVFIADNFPPVVDGVGDYTYHLSQEFARNGHQVHVICARKEAIIRQVEHSGPVTVLPVVPAWNRSAIPTILRTVAQIKPDWIIPQYVPYSYDYYGLPFWFYQLITALKKNKYRIAITFHEVFIDLELHQPKYLPVALAQRVIAFLVARRVDRIVVSIERVRRQLRQFAAKMTRIPVGSNIRTVPVNPQAMESLRKKLAPNGEFVLSSFGIRDQTTLIHLLKRLIQQELNVKLILLGKLQPDAVSEITNLIDQYNLDGKIYLPGYLNNVELYATLRCADAFVLLEENRGGVTTKSGSIAAAYSAGLPIIGTKGHMTDHFFADRKNILFTDAKSLDRMTDDVKSFIQNKDNLLNVLKEGSRRTYEEQLSWEKIYSHYEKVLHG